jgi:hypothetical protein
LNFGEKLTAHLINNVIYVYKNYSESEEIVNVPVYIMNAPIMFDSNGASSMNLKLDLEEIANVENKDHIYNVTLTPSAEWLNAPERAYPVYVDPTHRESFTNSNYATGITVYQLQGNQAKGDNGFTYVGRDFGTTAQVPGEYVELGICRVYMTAPIGNIPKDARIESATYRVTQMSDFHTFIDKPRGIARNNGFIRSRRRLEWWNNLE